MCEDLLEVISVISISKYFANLRIFDEKKISKESRKHIKNTQKQSSLMNSSHLMVTFVAFHFPRVHLT